MTHAAQTYEGDKLSTAPSSQTLLKVPHFPSPIASVDELRARASETGAIQQSKIDRSATGATSSHPRHAVRARTLTRHASIAAQSSAPSSAGFAGPLADRVIQRLLEKIRKMLPVYSGYTLNDLARNVPTNSSIQLFCSLAAPFPSQDSQTLSSLGLDASTSISNSNSRTSHKTGVVNMVARGLCELLESVGQLHAPHVQILHSQVFLLQVLLRFLAARSGPESDVPRPVNVNANEPKASDLTPQISPSHPAAQTSVPHLTLDSPHDQNRNGTLRPSNNSIADTADTLFAISSSLPPENTTSSFDPATTSYILSVLGSFIRCHISDLDLVSYRGSTTPQAPLPSSLHPSHSTPLPIPLSSPHAPTTPLTSPTVSPTSPLFKLQHSPHKTPHFPTSPTYAQSQTTCLTPFPAIPLHGFEIFASPALHADGVGILSPGVVLEHSTNTLLHPNPSIRTLTYPALTQHVVPVPPLECSGAGRPTYIPPYKSLHAHLDMYPPTLCFLPPATLIARYAARCIYFLSKCGGEGEDRKNEDEFVGRGRGIGGAERGKSDLVWEIIVSGIGRVAGVNTSSFQGKNMEPTTSTHRGGAGVEKGREKESQKAKEKERERQKQLATQKGYLIGSGKVPRRGMINPGWSLSQSQVQGSDEYKLGGQSRSKEEKNQQQQQQREEDVTELRMLGFMAMRKARLGGIVTELASLLINMSTPVRGVAAAAIRMSIFAWLETAPAEFVRLAGGNPSVYLDGGRPIQFQVSSASSQMQATGERLEGAERLLDLMVLLANAKEGYGGSADLEKEQWVNAHFSGDHEPAAGKQSMAARSLLWTGVGALFCVCTERVRGADVERPNNILTQMARFIRTPGPNADIALRVYADICRAAFFIPPREWKVGDESGGMGGGIHGKERTQGGETTSLEYMDEAPLRAVARDVVEELASFLEYYPPYNLHAIDAALYTDALIAIYRFLPKRAVHLIHGWLGPTRGEAIKLCVVQAIMTLTVEARVFPWQPPLSLLTECCSQQINILLRNLLLDTDEGASTHPLSISPSHPDRTALRRTLLLSIQGLLRLDLSFSLCGPATISLTDVGSACVHVLNARRDHGVLMMSFAMCAGWIAGARRVRSEGAILLQHHADADVRESVIPLYKAAGEYLRATVLTTLFACAQQIVHVWSFTENLLCIHAMKYILGILTDSVQDGEDTSWRHGEARFPALAMTEIALIVIAKSSQRDSSCAAVDCFPLLAQAIHEPNAPAPTYITHEQYPTWSAFHTATAKIASTALGHAGHAAAQKWFRDGVTSNAVPCVTHLAAWRECHFRWRALTPLVHAPEGAAEPLSQEQAQAQSQSQAAWSGVEIGPGSYKDRQAEWSAYGLAVSRATCVCQDDIDPTLLKALDIHLPDRLPMHHQPKKLVYEFVRDMVEMLTADRAHIRETAKQALGTELHFEVVPVLFEQLNSIVPDILKGVVSTPKDDTVLFIKHCVDVLSLLVDRVDDKSTLAACDVRPLLLPISRFLNLPLPTASNLRTRTQFCGVIQICLKRKNIFTFHKDHSYRQLLLDNTMSWTSTIPTASPEAQLQPEFVRSLHSCQVAALRTASELAENLQLKPLEKPTSVDSPQNDASRLFQRYLVGFVRGLNLIKGDGSQSTQSDPPCTSQPISRVALDETYIHESVIVGITNLLNANTVVGFKQCIGFGYHEDPHLRTIFMEVFSRVLERGTKFDTRDHLKLQVGSKDGQLCELVYNSEVLVDCMVTVCSSSEFNLLTSALLNIFDTRQALLGFARQLVSREIDQAESPTKLFRENNFINHTLSAIVNQHGYRFIRTVLEPLIEQTLQRLEDKSFELDPTKLQPGEDLEANRRLIWDLAQSFIHGIIASAPSIPSIIIDICHHISASVIKSWPDARYTTVGGFIFLRFFCPAIVSPESIDIELPFQDSQTRTKIHRGLLILAKILQTLSNNLMFGREAHMVFLNPLLEFNIGPMTNFLEESFISHSSEHTVDQWLGTTYDTTDSMILYTFFHRHHDEIGRILLSGPSVSGTEPAAREPAAIWTQLCNILAELPPIIDLPNPDVPNFADNVEFQQFMMQNAHRNRDPVRHIFHACEDRPDVFVLQQRALNVETVDLNLLRYHLCCSLKEYLTSPIDCVFVLDYTRFKNTAELPVDWLKNGIETIPADMRGKIHAMYILNANSLTLRFFRKFFLISPESYLAREVHAVSSVAELFEHIGHVESIWKSWSGLLEAESPRVFRNVYQRYVHHKESAVTLEIRESHLRIISRNPQEITPRMFCKTVEIILLDEVDDIYKIASEADSDLREFIISRYRHNDAMQFSARKRNTIIQAIRAALSKANSSSLHTLEQFSGLSDITVTLFTIALINTCHELGWPRGAANKLLTAMCSYLKYEGISEILPPNSTSFNLNPSAALVLFSERVASLAPHLTLDFIIEFRWGYNRATNHKLVCLSYLSPWIRNISRFATPGDALFDSSGGKLRDAIHSLCDISLKDKDVYHQAKQCVWIELSKMDDMTLGIVMDELMRLAVDSGIESFRSDLILDVTMALSSIQVRSRILHRLRQALRKQTLSRVTSEAENIAWSEVATLSRLALAVSYNSRQPAQNHLFIAETVHVVTMVAAAGPLEMRTSIYGLVSNLLRTLSNNRNSDETSTSEFRQLVADFSGPSIAHLFGISLAHTGMEYALTKVLSEYHPDATAVEDITKMLVRMIEYGAGTPGLVNVLKARWMSLVTVTAFQSFPYMQARAFTVLGVLMKDSLNNEFLYQILGALKCAIRDSPDGNCITVLSILRCMRTLIPGMRDSSPYLCGIFWMAVALLQTAHFPYYIESMHLIRSVLEKLQAQSAFVASNMSSVLLQARSILSELAGFDEISGFSFTDELSFSLSTAYLLCAIFQHQKLRPIAGGVLRAFLRIASKSAQGGSGVCMNTREIDPSLIGFFLGCLPFCNTVPSLRELLEDARVDVQWWESNGLFNGTDFDGYKCAVPFSLLGVSDDRSAYLIIAFLVSMIELRQGDLTEREILSVLLADASEKYPSLVSESRSHYLTHIRGSWIDERIDLTFAGHTTPPMLTAEVKIIQSILAFADQWKLVDTSTSTLSSSSEDSPTPHYLTMEELGMSGFTTHLHPHRKETQNFALFSPLFNNLLERILEL